MFTNLQILDLSENNFQGNIQVIRSLAPSLKVLLLANNQLEGIFPTNGLDHLLNLQVVSISFNQISGSLRGLATLPQLQEIRAQGNALDEVLPAFDTGADVLTLVRSYNIVLCYNPSSYQV